MGFWDLFRRRVPAPRPAPDPATLQTLWRHVDGLPDPYQEFASPAEDYEKLLERIGDRVHQIGQADIGRFLAEYREAFAALDSAEHARHLRAHPWRGPEQPFCTREFGLARERALLRGEPFFRQVLADPARLGVIDTGPTVTSRQLVRSELPNPLHDTLGIAAQRLGLQEEIPWLGSVPGSYPDPGTDPGRWPELVPRKYRWARYDVETVALIAVSRTGRADLAELPAELSDAEAQALQAWPQEMIELLGEQPPAPLQALVDIELCEAVARVWDALGNPSCLVRSSVLDMLTVAVVLTDRWRPAIVSEQEPTVEVAADDLAAMPRAALADALTAVVATSCAAALGKRRPERATLHQLRDRYGLALPERARKALQVGTR